MATGTIPYNKYYGPSDTIPIANGGTAATTQAQAARNIAKIYRATGQSPSITVPNGRYVLVAYRISAYLPVSSNWCLSLIGGYNGTTEKFDMAKSTNTTPIALTSTSAGLTVSITGENYYDLLIISGGQ